MIAESWSANGERAVPLLDFPQTIRKVIYTTNAIEAVNTGRRGDCPTAQAPGLNHNLAYSLLMNRT